jgi:CheY-like chemotaxis protein
MPFPTGVPESQPRDTERRAVLVVENDTVVRRLITKTLRGMGLVALEAGSAVEGLAVFRRHAADIDLAIITVILPVISGLDLAAELDRRRPGFKILYSSDRLDSVAMECIAQQRPECVLPKPFTQPTLVAKVRRLVF